jgi:Serine/threonine protein kinase
MPIAESTPLGPYKVLSPLGAGGMGEVYLAADTRLHRKVALKILPADLASDRKRMDRFNQEAMAAAALNHPHITHIYEIGEADGVHFIAMEYIDGETLHQRTRTGIKLTDILDITTQTASALAAAHAAGIIHRDIKPENIMVRRDGYIKVLDFGLAKLTQPSDSTTDTEAPTKAMVNTGAGTVMGTANYMSPEQAKGTHVDARSDLWSLGAVLYEMITGRVPFPGETPTETISLILQREPAPLTRFVPDVNAELERIVIKTLTKDREERYQTAKDLLIDLRNLKRKLEVDAEIERTLAPEFRPSTSTASGQGNPVTISGSLAPTSPAKVPPAASSAEYIVSGIKQHKLIAAIAIIVLAIGIVGLSAYLHARNTAVAIDSIAVLPFVNQNDDPDTEYLSDGLAESLIYRLSQLPNLKVSPTSSVFRYKGKDVDPIKVGNQLGVSAVLSGRITQRGDDLTISAELVDVRYNKLLWGEQYDRKTSELLATQREIAREIADNLRLKVSPQERGLAKHYTDSNEAYQLYLKGRFYWNRRTAEGLKKCIEQFQQAVDKDPSFALAYVGLADCYTPLEEYAGTPSSQTLPVARAAAMRALQLDDSLAEAHTSLGYVNIHSWQFSDAEKELKRGIELNPNYPTGHLWYSIYLRSMGRLEEAMAENKRAQQLDPLSPIMVAAIAPLYNLKGDLKSGIEEVKKVIEMDPNFPLAHGYLGLAYLKQGREQDAITELQKAVELSGKSSEQLSFLGYAYGVIGKRAEALAVLRQLEERYARRESPAMFPAAVYVGLGEKNQAFDWLERDFQSRTGLLVFITFYPHYDTLRDDPRYTDLLRRIGLRP